jgi:poly(glycerol-phosphate) alpha-glucosyltransferase
MGAPQGIRSSAMPSIELPAGRYLSCAFGVSPDAAGQTRALLMRNRFLASEGGVRPDVLSLGPTEDHEERRRILLERGLLSEDLGYRNVYEHYREHGWGDAEPIGELDDLSARRVGEETRADGSPWRILYRLPGTSRPMYDYLRDDGSPFLRISGFGVADRSSWSGTIQQVGPQGAVVGEFKSPGQWFRTWIRELCAGHEQAFVFIDSRFVVPHIVPIRARRIHVLYLMHNVHVLSPRRWDSEVHQVYGRVLARIDGMNAMVNLTERQRDDIARRRGRTTNMFVVPNPVDVPEPPPDLPPRDPNLVVVMARLEAQKRLRDAIAAMALVREKAPGARLEIYGDGSQRSFLEREIAKRGVGDAVFLRGFDPHAREVLWTASAFVMTSSFEGYPLSTLESMSRGCPVVSYDIKYGPREQITDGVEGFVVPAGDLDQLAARVVELLRSPELVGRMSAAARRRVQRYGPAEFTARWAGVIREAVALEPMRVRLDAVELELTRLRAVPPGRLRRGRDFAARRVPAAGRLELAGTLRIEAHVRRARLDTAELALDAIDDETGEVRGLPLTVAPAERALTFSARLRLGDIVGTGSVRLRLRLTWQNASWETDLSRPPGGEDEVSVSFGPDGRLALSRPAT